MCPKLIKTTWFGTFVLDGKNVVDKTLFKPDAETIAKNLKAMSEGSILEEERAIYRKHTPRLTTDPRLLSLGPTLDTQDFTPDPRSYNLSPALLADASRLVGEMKAKREIGPDMFLIQLLNSYDNMIEVHNLTLDRLKGCYGLHWPELLQTLAPEEYLPLIVKHGDRAAIASSGAAGLPDPGHTLGGDIAPSDLQAARDLAKMLLDMAALRTDLEAKINKRSLEVAPNLTTLLGPMISARLIMLAGGLQRLAKFPASTIQLLGAEKAMFRAKREGQRRPKHGAIFMHPLIHGSPYWRRGKIARMMAGKAAIAARVDYNHGQNMGEALRAEMERKAQEIAKRHPEAPKRERPQMERKHEKGREGPRANRPPRRHSY